MRLLDKIRHHPADKVATETPEGQSGCLHTALTPRWDTLSEMGDEEKASAWVCPVCGGTFTPDEARELRTSEAERVKQVLRAD